MGRRNENFETISPHLVPMQCIKGAHLLLHTSLDISASNKLTCKRLGLKLLTFSKLPYAQKYLLKGALAETPDTHFSALTS